MSTQQLIYSNHRILGVIFVTPPWKVFLSASAIAICLLLLPAFVFRIHSIPTAKGNLGLFYSYNWSLMYPVLIPLMLAMAAAVSGRMRSCILELESNGRITKLQESGPSYAEALSDYLKSRARTLVIVALFITLLVTLLDTYNLWVGFLPGHVPPVSRKPEWDTAFNAGNWGAEYVSQEFLNYLQTPPTKGANFVVDLIAYILQGTVFFLALFWVGKFMLFLLAFASLIGGANPSHRFNPLTDDLDLRMGLKPMGKLFDNFLAITLIIEGYAFYHRLHLIKLANKEPLSAYVTTTMRNIVFPAESASVPYPLTHLTELFKLSSWALNVDVSGIITIVFMSIPIAVVCFLPMWKIRNLVDRRRNEELKRLQTEHSEALEARNMDLVNLVLYKKQCLEKANIWPNGDARAKRYLTVILALAAGALSPPLLALVLAFKFSEGCARYLRLVFQKPGN